MRKTLIALAASVLMLPTLAVGATANDGWSLEFTSAELYYKGLNLELTAEIVCPEGAKPVSVSFQVRQNVHRDSIAKAGGTFAPATWVCNGSFKNQVTAALRVSDGPAFKNGAAVADQWYDIWGPPHPELPAIELKLKKAK